MALQVAIAHSATVRGAGLIAGGPWHCAEGSSRIAQERCMGNAAQVDVESLVNHTRQTAAKGAIDDVKNLATSKFYVFGSEKDTVVKPPAADRLTEYLSAFTSRSQILIEKSVPAAHGWPTENFGNACGQMGIPWLNKCGYDSAAKILGQLYGTLAPRTSAVSASLKSFDQSEFDPAGAATLGRHGYVYVPAACASKGGCRVHVAFHGCQMSSDIVQDKFAVNSGLNEWAETNDVVVLYPQTKASGSNPFGCWDWFGYTGPEYDTKNGAQVKAVRAMIDRLTSP